MQKEDKSKDCERPRVLAVLAVPGYMTPTDFLSFASGFAESIEHVRVVRDSSQNHYMILLRFRAMADADAFYAYYNGKTFSPLEPETCHVVYVSAVECESKEIPAGSDEAPVDGRVSAPAAALFLRPAWADSGDADELPTCPVCLERLDSSTSGLLTILCQHTFHCGCLARWGDGSCPVCRHSQTSPDALSQQQASGSGTPDAGPSASPGSSSSAQQGEAGNCCSVCREANDLWICLICGTIGCGRYVNGHAKDHFNQTQHPYSMELESQCVWDYVGDGYVHRLIQNKADGKVIEFAAPERTGGGGGYVEDGHMGSFVDAREKLDAVTEEYEILLTSQLESQREHYEMQIARMQHQQSQWPKQYAELERKYDALSGRCRELDQKCQVQESRHQTETQGLSSKMEEERKEWAAERRRLEASATKWLKKSTEDARLLLDEKALSKQLLDNQDALKKQVADLKESMADLQEQVRDLTFFISTQKVIEKEQQQEGGGGELEGASVVGVAEAPQPKGKGKGKGKGKRRILPRK
ncbi:BRAP2-domain-containing protein [Martensiomyces pterosporus]|nr:BRAP2-domain-containing protein [Martensiomyces pterosporus]